MSLAAEFALTGFIRFGVDTALLDWLKIAGPAALATRHDPAFAEWLRCEETWFVGVNALANDGQGALNGSGALSGRAVGFIRNNLGFGGGAFDRGQVSICYPGFPKPQDGETAGAFAYRRDRDGAHVDGLHPVGPERRRKVQECQGFLLGLPVTTTNALAAPLVVWQGSHKIMQAMFVSELAGVAPADWHKVDLTQAYHAARRQVFETCARVVVHARPGEAYVLHRFALHGVSQWQTGAVAPETGRAILYFRPEIDQQDWLFH